MFSKGTLSLSFSHRYPLHNILWALITLYTSSSQQLNSAEIGVLFKVQLSGTWLQRLQLYKDLCPYLIGNLHWHWSKIANLGALSNLYHLYSVRHGLFLHKNWELLLICILLKGCVKIGHGIYCINFKRKWKLQRRKVSELCDFLKIIMAERHGKADTMLFKWVLICKYIRYNIIY